MIPSFSVLLCFLHLCISRRFVNPVLPSPITHPSVVKHGGLYYAVGEFDPSTQETMPIYVSTDLETWKIQGIAFDRNNLPTWIGKYETIKAPVIFVMDNNTFRLYFTACALETGHLSIGVATAIKILGPYKSMEAPLLFNEDENAGATILLSNNKLYMIWSAMFPSHVYNVQGQQLSDDGLRLEGEKSEVLLSREPYFGIFGPSAFFWNDYNYIFYSKVDSCSFDTRDAIWVAKSSTPLGTYEMLEDPTIVANADYSAPAQGGVVQDLDDESFAFLYQTYNGNSCYGPYLTAATLRFDNCSWPYVEDFLEK